MLELNMAVTTGLCVLRRSIGELSLKLPGGDESLAREEEDGTREMLTGMLLEGMVMNEDDVVVGDVQIYGKKNFDEERILFRASP